MTTSLQLPPTPPAGGVDLTLEGVRQPTNRVGTTEWRHPVTNELHRLDGPAIEGEAGHSWFLNGVAHRDGGPQFYAVSGGPAEYWYRHGELHRLDGPAWTDTEGGHVWMVRNKMVDDDDAPVLEELYAAGETRLLELVLSVWRPGGPPAVDLLAAVRTATA